MKPVVIIPARYGSSRFPGKPLAMIHGKPMIQRVYEQAIKAVADVWVATDDMRIEDEVERFGGKCILTSTEHRSGTDRLAEAIGNIPQSDSFDVVVNIQGDEPFIEPSEIIALIDLFQNKATQIATLVKEIETMEDLFNPNKPKVVISNTGKALYFSRSPIPYMRDVDKSFWHQKHEYYKHIGVYAYQKNVLLEISKLNPSLLEIAENLEQLRWLEHDYSITTAITNFENLSVDTPEDLEYILTQKK